MSMPGFAFVKESTQPSLESVFMITLGSLAESRAIMFNAKPPRESVMSDGSKSSFSVSFNISSLS